MTATQERHRLESETWPPSGVSWLFCSHKNQALQASSSSPHVPRWPARCGWGGSSLGQQAQGQGRCASGWRCPVWRLACHFEVSPGVPRLSANHPATKQGQNKAFFPSCHHYWGRGWGGGGGKKEHTSLYTSCSPVHQNYMFHVPIAVLLVQSVLMCLGKPICTPPGLSHVSQAFPLKQLITLESPHPPMDNSTAVLTTQVQLPGASNLFSPGGNLQSRHFNGVCAATVQRQMCTS